MKTLRDIWFIGSRDLLHMLRQKETILWTFVMPFVFFTFIGSVTSGGGSGGQNKPSLALRVDAEAGFLADEFEIRLGQADFVILRPDENPDAPYTFEQYIRRIEIPAGLTESVLAGEQAELLFQRQGAGINADVETLRVRRAVYTVLADVLAATAHAPEGSRLGPKDLIAIREMPRSLSLDVTHAGKRPDPPSGFEQAIPGTMVMFTMIVLLTGGAANLVVERQLGVLRRLASAPMSRSSVVAGKWAAKLGLGMVQVCFAMLTGTLVFTVSWGSNLPMVLLVMLAYAALLASLSMLLGSLASTTGQAVGVGVLCSTVLGALGGCWWPIEITPPFMQTLAMFLPTGWTMGALHGLVNFGAEPLTALPHVAILALCAAALGWLSTRVFRFE